MRRAEPDWQAVKQAVTEALELPAGERQAHLASRCETRPVEDHDLVDPVLKLGAELAPVRLLTRASISASSR